MINRKFEAERLKFDLTLKENNELTQAHQQLLKHLSNGNLRRCEEYLK